MSDVEDIQKTINTYSVGATLRDWDMVLSVFMDDATWHLTGSEYNLKGKAELRVEFPKFIDDMEFFAQTNAPALIEVTGDTATAKNVIREWGKLKGKNEAVEIVGIYADKLVRTPQGWRFSNRTFTVVGVGRTELLANAQLPRDG